MPAYMSYLIVALAILVAVAVHELGHLIIARRNGVKVNTFSVGLGPSWGFIRRGIRWQLALIPLGGFVHMKGMQYASAHAAARELGVTPAGDETATAKQLHELAIDPQSNLTAAERTRIIEVFSPDSYNQASAPAKLRILVAGCVVNIVMGLALLIFATWQYSPAYDSTFKLGAETKAYESAHQDVMGAEITKAEDGGDTLVLKSGERVPAKGAQITRIDRQTGYRDDITLWSATTFSTERLVDATGRVVRYLPDFFTKPEVREEAQSVIMIVHEAPDYSRIILTYIAGISISLGLLNLLLPIVPLDGGRMVLVALRGMKVPVSEKTEIGISLAGAAVFLLIMGNAISNDLQRLF